MIRHYILPPAESARVFEAGGPLVDLQLDPAKLAQMSIVVVEVDGKIVAYWLAWYGLHLEPLWIQEAHRRSPGVARGLVEEMQQLIERSGEQAAFAVIDQDSAELAASYAERLGFHQAPGNLYYVVREPARAVEGV